MFIFRNLLAHGKSVVLGANNEIRVVDERFDKYMYEPLKTDWETYCTQDNANRALVNSEAIITELNKLAGMDPDFTFRFGIHEVSAALLPEEQSCANTEVTL